MGNKENKPGIGMIHQMMMILAVLLFINPAFVGAQKVIPDTTRFLIGTHVNITLEIEAEQGSAIGWPEFSDTLTRSLEIVFKNPVDTIRTEGKNSVLYKQVLTLTSFDTGYIVLPPLSFKVRDNNNQTTEVKSEALLFEVLPMQVDMSKDIMDIKPVMTAPYTLRDFLPWLLLAAAGLLGTLIWFYIRNRRKNLPLIKLPSKPLKPAHVIALEMLEELRKDQVWQKGQIKEYYTRLTDILREYFEKRYGVSAAEMTSDEILSEMKDHFSEVSLMSDLRKILTLADLAKFAKGQPIGAENELSLTYARTIIMNSALAQNIGEAATNTLVNDNPLKKEQTN